MSQSHAPEFFSALLEDSPQATLVYGTHHRCVWASPGFARLARRPIAEYLDASIEELWKDIHPGDLGPAQLAWQALQHQGQKSPSQVPFLFRMRVRSGEYRLVELLGRNRCEEPAVQGLVLHLSLVVDRKRAEDLLLSERERLLVTLRSIGDGVIATDVDGHITLTNSVTETLTEWSQAEALGRPLTEVFHIIHEETGVLCENPVEKVFLSGSVVGLANHTALVSKSGRVSIIEDSAAPIRDSDGTIIGAVLVFRDVTEVRKTAADLLRMQKLESIGVLAGGIAHDFNNLLTAILGNASLAAIQIEALHPAQRLLSDIQQAARRSSDLTQQLLTFSKGGVPVLKATQISELVRETTEFLLRGTAVDCRFEFAPHLKAVMVDPGQMGQVIQNLVLNASQAMGGSGRLIIRGACVELGHDKPATLEPGTYLRLDFIDTGPGLPAEILERVFEPYFTTKASGNGLGLAVVWSIIKNHGGWIEAQSRIGEGTNFVLWVPAQFATPDEAGVARPTEAVPRQGRALVMDDEATLRTTIGGMLRYLGMDCLESDSGEAALALLSLGQPVDLAIVDLTVKAGMGGRELVGRLKGLYPDLTVVVTSGYSNDQVMADFRGFGFDAALSKPFSLAELSRVVEEALRDSK